MSDCYNVHRVELERGRVRFYMRWLAADPEKDTTKNKMYVDLSLDGCVTIHIEKNFLYPGESASFVKCIEAARAEHSERKRRERAAWYEEHKDLKKHYECDITYSIEETKIILETAPMRLGEKDLTGEPNLEIQVDQQWLSLCRTDLTDDVATHIVGHTRGGVDEARRHYFSVVGYGARVRDGLFAVVDAYSDG